MEIPRQTVGMAAALIQQFRSRWATSTIFETLQEMITEGDEFADVVAAGLRAARDPESIAPTAVEFRKYWDRPDTAYRDAVAAAKQAIRERAARVRACDRCDGHGYIDGRICRHVDPEEAVRKAHEHAETARAEIRPTRESELAKIDRSELVGTWEATEEERAAAQRRLDEWIAEHPDAVPEEAQA